MRGVPASRLPQLTLRLSTNTHVPAPYWCAVVPVKIPLVSCNEAADALIDWFGPEELKRVVGGERWWQIRGLDWIDAEWVTEKEYLEDRSFSKEDHYTEEEKTTMRMEHLDRVMVRCTVDLTCSQSLTRLDSFTCMEVSHSCAAHVTVIQPDLNLSAGASFWGSISMFGSFYATMLVTHPAQTLIGIRSYATVSET